MRDDDLQLVVNALWAAGAEAISINGQRLGPTTAIRFAGEAVLVDFRPVTNPYEISAIGDPDTLSLDVPDGPAGQSPGGDLRVVRAALRASPEHDELSLPPRGRARPPSSAASGPVVPAPARTDPVPPPGTTDPTPGG